MCGNEILITTKRFLVNGEYIPAHFNIHDLRQLLQGGSSSFSSVSMSREKLHKVTQRKAIAHGIVVCIFLKLNLVLFHFSKPSCKDI